jgi:hypothetical protein
LHPTQLGALLDELLAEFMELVIVQIRPTLLVMREDVVRPEAGHALKLGVRQRPDTLGTRGYPLQIELSPLLLKLGLDARLFENRPSAPLVEVGRAQADDPMGVTFGIDPTQVRRDAPAQIERALNAAHIEATADCFHCLRHKRV